MIPYDMAKEIEIKDKKLFSELSAIIESRKTKIVQQANSGVVQMFWEVGRRINDEILKNKRAEYGKQIIATVSQQLEQKYGSTFAQRNLRRMMQFAEQYPDFKIVSPLATQLTWSHIVELLPLSHEAQVYYMNEVKSGLLSKRDLRYMISRKAFERREIANSQLGDLSLVPFNSFKDPYLLDTLGLKDNFLEADLENAILIELEKFILELGHGFTFVGRQKRIHFGDRDYYIDLLFYQRDWQRLVAVELKLGEFRPEHKGQMEFYLRWLNENERKDGENQPIGLILCTKANRGVLELMELDKVGISVAEIWTKLPPEFDVKIKTLVAEAQERIERRAQLGSGKKGQINYFIEPENE